MEENEKMMNRGGSGADGTRLLLGITKASISNDSFIAGLFPRGDGRHYRTSRWPTSTIRNRKRPSSRAAEVEIASGVDYLRGLKENVIVGRLIPLVPHRGTYFEKSHTGIRQ